MGQYNPNAPLAVGNEFAPVLYSPYTPDLFVERGWSFRLDAPNYLTQANLYFDSIPSWAVPGHAYVVTVYRRGQEANTGPLKTVTVPLIFDSAANTALGGGAPSGTPAIANPSDGWYYRLRTTSTNEAYSRWRTGTIPAELSEPLIAMGKRIHDVSILYTATAEPGNETPVPLQINHFYEVNGQRVPYGTAQVDLVESLNTNIRRNRWGEICTWFRVGTSAANNPFTADTSRATWNYDLLTLFATGGDFLVEFRTEAAAQDGAREIYLQYAAMQITYSEENRLANWGVVLGSDYTLVDNDGTAGGHRVGRNTQGLGNGSGFSTPNAIELAPGGGSSGAGVGQIADVFDVTVTVKRADYGPYNNQGPAGKIRALRTVDVFPGHPGVVINNTLEPGQTPTVGASDLLPQIVLQTAGGFTAPPQEFGYVYGLQAPLQVYANNSAVQEIVPLADGPDTPFTKVRFWARSNEANSALRLVIDTADQGPVTVANLEPAELESFPEIADGWRQIDLEVDPALLIDDWSVASGTQPAVQSTVHEPGSGAAWNVTAPAGNLEGRLLLLWHCADLGNLASLGTPTGGTTWNILQQAGGLGGTGIGGAKLWWKIGGAAEPASYGITQNTGADAAVIVTAIENADPASLQVAGTFFDPAGNSPFVSTPNVPLVGEAGLDLRFAAGIFSGATWTPPNDWVLLAGSVGTPFSSTGLAARNTNQSSGVPLNMTSSLSNSTGRFGVTVTLTGAPLGPAAPRWESDTSLIRPWEILAARVVDPNLPGDVFNPAAPSEMGIGTYGGALAEGGIDGFLPVTADIDAAVVWGQAMPQIEGLQAEIQLQPLAVVDPDCPAVPACVADGIQYYQLSWTAIDSGPEFVGLGSYELQRRDETIELGDWETVAQAIHPLANEFADYEFRIGVDTWYRIRYVHQNGMAGDWTEIVAPEIAAPGVTGAGQARGVLVFTSNADPSRNLAYVQIWQGAANEDFNFVESDTRELQRMYGRDYSVAFRPLERGGVQFTRSMLVHAATIPVETLSKGFNSLRDLAWAELPYVCVRSERGDRWLSNVNVPTGSIRSKRKLYVAEVQITEVTAEPFPVESHYCEGMTARGALPSTVYEPRFATTPDQGQFTSADISLRAEIRLDEADQRITLGSRFDSLNRIGWYFVYWEDGTLGFFIQDGLVFDDSEYESSPVPFGAGDRFWVRVDYDPDGGGATSTAQFYTSPDGVTWNSLATTPVTTDSVPGNDPTFANLPLTVGALADGSIPQRSSVSVPFTGAAGGWNGVIGQMQYLGDGGVVVADPDFQIPDPAAVQFIDGAGNRWSVDGGICTVDRRL